MKKIILLNPEKAQAILKDQSLTAKNDNIIACVNGKDDIILNSNEYNKESFAAFLKIGFDGGGVVGIRNSYITISLKDYSNDVEIELVEMQYGLALIVNRKVVYYKIRFKTFDELLNLSDLKAIDLSGWNDLDNLNKIKHLTDIESFKLTIGDDEDTTVNNFSFQSLEYFTKLTCLHLTCTYTEDLNRLYNLSKLKILFIELNDGWGDEENYMNSSFNFAFISGMVNLRILSFYKTRKISDVSFLNSLIKLEELEFNSPYALEEINLNTTLNSLYRLELSIPDNLRNLEFFKYMPNIKFLKIDSGSHILDFTIISELYHLKELELTGMLKNTASASRNLKANLKIF
jgi:hypothetical protein